MQRFINNWATVLTAPALAGDLSLSVDPGKAAELVGLGGGDHYLLTLSALAGDIETAWEIVKVTAVSGSVLTVQRAQEGTAAVGWGVDADISARATAGSLIDLRGATTAQGALADTAVQPDDLSTYERTLTAGANVTIDRTNPAVPVISASITGGGGGDVVGPASAVANQVALFDGITGKLIKAGGLLGTAAAAATGDFVPAAHAGAGGTAHANAVAAGAAGFMTGADKTKLDGVASGATANATNADLRDRSTHTGTQPQSSITGLTAALDKVKLQSITLACSDETTALAAGTGKVTFRLPYALTLTGVRASLTTAQTSGSIITVDINEAGVTILSTKLTIDNTEKTSTTAATAAVVSDATLADDAEITIDIDQIGDGTAKGLKVTLIGYQP